MGPRISSIIVKSVHYLKIVIMNISDWHSLHTPKTQQDEFSMLVFPDSQSANYSDWKNLAQMAWK